MATDPNEITDQLSPTPDPAPRPPRRVAWWQWLAFALLVALLGLVAYQFRSAQVRPGDPAPEFELQTFDGGTLKLADLRGQVVVVNFWASWCIPCVEEAAALENSWQLYQERGVVFVGVAWSDTEPNARAFVDQYGATYRNGQDLGTVIADRYHITGVPETFIIAPDGKLHIQIVGPVTVERLQTEIDPLLSAAASN